MKKTIIILIVIILLAVAGFYIINLPSGEEVDTEEQTKTEEQKNNEQVQEETGPKSVIGTSVEGRDINAYTYGTGDTHLLFVGGIHGGYSWNTALVAYELIDYLNANADTLADNLKVTVIPVLNPDGLNEAVGATDKFTKAQVSTSEDVRAASRFNGNTVDLNRNFDCDWQSEGTWQTKTVSGGSAAFSEPEAQAIKNYIESNDPEAVVVWYSSAGGVFASNCHNGVLAETREILNVFAKASGYKAYDEFNFYEITGDMTNWLAKIGTPSISVLLTTHDDTEWSKNRAGIEALFEYYGEETEETPTTETGTE